MAEFELRQIGNIDPETIHEHPMNYDLDATPDTPSLAEDWRRQGIRYELTDPVPTNTYTTEQLRAMGMKGVTLLIPMPDALDS